ncbi:hypothetical protein J2X19_000756 [Rhodoferax ferrireducens]|uniref:DUF1993 domain-containing protein n=1 Tax=Rhodoferax ferrireducens TaxID=192843 RepID=A0ABU2C439_9BURK|nr:DUF1993 domain-containing protein [Rhodoferax ferrireducens]MDR7376098.1 hypothetical protein [Rhodoferax ferrireducens]
MYATSVPVFQRYLGQLAQMLKRAETSELDPQRLLQARLAPDMLPLSLQVEIATNFAVRACAPLAGLEVPPFGEPGHSFAALHARITRAQQFLAALSPEQLADSAQRICTDQAGQATLALPGEVFLSQYALPNFFFHLSSAYALLRQQGVRLGKADFDGWHVY